ncbi:MULTISPECIES: NADH:ubiquinone reductase (Na(+)-transporting) subunit E [Shewanella]|jgi:Na+-transporting NADH:ubiquinone oxidoreductase subunit E|uniref:Na(+)-translocating NADH-quinone reductase subunit E n=3 Tax=Shewanella putrefaciens TaxID=24 RepID=E6XL66_SHEP2|nr:MULTISPECIES: NADH:ubiquinone reductase (Na(+)-transporting) subunit E [Shewanella]CAD6365998.1 Na(+)-translocating NADH-quinone reductase subunit E [Shewanella hafniensis]ABM26134.1 NADH:ubiquinone oxidoreductase, subunit E [Shewanella sp. W3-18-1]AVV83651.1 Na(+)-translocating NADH-quinone reductase subunit E [Shewanella putrefaciens]MCA1898232.1 NADH:ubiquinone reductase (Na(+)-transporting) subunit E [Shewanella putrefaciens]MCK7630364.1 NADH:ubiquinone reductase (Na(+)-transporting) su
MEHYINLFLQAAFIDNMALSFFLGMCTFLAVSKKVSTAFGLGVAVIVVMTLAVPLNQLIYVKVLAPGALSWAGLATIDLSYLQLITFIGVIAALVQILEMFLDKYIPSLYDSLGIFLPLLTVNCAIFAGVIFMANRDYNFTESAVFAMGSGLGWALAIVMLAGLRERMKFHAIPEGLQGIGITFITTGLMALGFMSFSGISL